MENYLLYIFKLKIEMKYKIALFLLFVLLSNQSYSQSNKYRIQKEAAMELSKSLEVGLPEDSIAKNYEKLARELIHNKDYLKAEENLLKARDIYSKSKDNEKVAAINREIAKLKESQNQIREAIINYKSARSISKSKTSQIINESDAQRLLNRSDKEVQSQYINQKIQALEEDKSQEEVSEAYIQLAQVNIEDNKPEKAISNYEMALQNAPTLEDEISIQQEIAQVYASSQNIDKAIQIQEDLVQKSKDVANPSLQISQLRNLSSSYLENSNKEKGLESMMKAYEIAVENGHTYEAKESVSDIARYYKENKQPKAALEIYADFLEKLEQIVKSDSSLVDAQIFQINEDKINRLEKERILKDELIKRKNLFNNILLVVILIIFILLFFIIRSLLSIRTKNKKIALQSLRREMNPHFIFNSLNSVNQFIAQNNELEANRYLSSYSKLMRNILENSNKDFIPLFIEIDHIKEYLQLENMRFGEKFSYRIEISPNIDIDATLIPNMLIQPQLENAIWHGLRYKKEKGFLLLNIDCKENILFVTIEDDGIGMEESRRIKTEHQRKRKSRGLSNTLERIDLLNHLYNTNIQMEINERGDGKNGVIVIITIPIK